jgi:polysaccharide export outer membrane protein
VTRLVLLCLLVLVVAAGCGGSGARPEADISTAADREGTETALVLPEPAPYRLAAGDVLNVNFFYYKQYNFSTVVRPDGMITVPLMGEVKALGMKPADLQDLIKEHYADLISEPEVSVMVVEFANQRYFVFGEVHSPGAYPLLGSMTLLDAIAQAGDIKPSGRDDNVILMRKGDDGRYSAHIIDVDAKLKGREMEVVYLTPTDIIYVPMTTIGKVDEFVNQFFVGLSPAWRFYLLGREVLEAEGTTVISQ